MKLRLTRTTWAVVVPLALLAVVYVAALYVAKSYYEPPSPDASSYNGAPNGTKVFYLYLARLGHQLGRLEQSERIPRGVGTLVLVTPLVREPTIAETKMMNRWVARGGRLVLVGSVVTSLHENFGFGFSHYGSRWASARPSQPGPLVAGISRVKLRDRARLGGTDFAVSYLEDGNDSVLAYRRWGRGSVVALADSFPVTNAGISRADNFALAANLAGSDDGRILFDEYHHGYSTAPGPLGILAPSSRYGLGALALACLLFLYGWGRRLGPALSFEPRPSRPATEYAYSLGELFETAGARGQALGILGAGLKRRMGHRAAPAGGDFDATSRLAANLTEMAKVDEVSQHEFSRLGRQAYEARMGVERIGRGKRRKAAL